MTVFLFNHSHCYFSPKLCKPCSTLIYPPFKFDPLSIKYHHFFIVCVSKEYKNNAKNIFQLICYLPSNFVVVYRIFIQISTSKNVKKNLLKNVIDI